MTGTVDFHKRALSLENLVTKSPNQNYGTIRWILLSQLLLALYLAFFHTVLGKSPTEILYAGLAFSALTTGIVVLCRNLFFNRFEYLIHLAIGLDIFCEGFVPFHETLGFYYCAFAFWSVFWGYHGLLLYRQKSQVAPEPTPDVQISGS